MREEDDRETGEQRREQREEANAGRKRRGREKQLKLGWDAMMGLCCVAM